MFHANVPREYRLARYFCLTDFGVAEYTILRQGNWSAMPASEAKGMSRRLLKIFNGEWQ